MSYAIRFLKPFGPANLRFHSLLLKESVSQVSDGRLIALSRDRNLSIDAQLGQKVMVEIVIQCCGKRFHNAYVTRFEAGARHEDELSEGTHSLGDVPFVTACSARDPSMQADLAIGSGADLDNTAKMVCPVLFYVRLPEPGTSHNVFLRIHWTWRFSYSAGDLADVEKFMRFAVKTLPILHATVGLGVQMSLSPAFFSWELDAAIGLYPWIQQYPGLDCYEPEEVASVLSRATYMPNWLTIIGRDLLRRHKIDPAAFRQASLPQLSATSEDWGFLLKVGEHPALDPLTEHSIATWKFVSQTLAPARVKELRHFCIAPPPMVMPINRHGRKPAIDTEAV